MLDRATRDLKDVRDQNDMRIGGHICTLQNRRRRIVKESLRSWSRNMPAHHAIVEWANRGPDFLKGKYSREHTWTFDGGVIVPASPAPSVVPAPWSNAANVDPEEAFVASIASCHMLTFLWVASKAGFVCESYRDDAVGTMTKNDRGVWWVSQVVLKPQLSWQGDRIPTAEELQHLHHRAHEECFIANSVKTTVTVEL